MEKATKETSDRCLRLKMTFDLLMPHSHNFTVEKEIYQNFRYLDNDAKSEGLPNKCTLNLHKTRVKESNLVTLEHVQSGVGGVISGVISVLCSNNSSWRELT